MLLLGANCSVGAPLPVRLYGFLGCEDMLSESGKVVMSINDKTACCERKLFHTGMIAETCHFFLCDRFEWQPAAQRSCTVPPRDHGALEGMRPAIRFLLQMKTPGCTGCCSVVALH